MFQTISIFLLAVGMNDHVMIVPLLIRAAGRDAWFAAVLSGAIMVVLSLFLFGMIRMSKQQPIGPWLKQRLSPVLANGLLVALALPLFISVAITLRDTTHWARLSFYEATPYAALLIPLMAVCFYLAYAGIGSIAIVSGLLIPFVIAFGFLVMTANLPHKDTALLFPILENGWGPVWKGIVFCLSGLTEIFMLIFMQHFIKGRIRYWTVLLTALLLMEMIFGPTYGALTEFGPEESKNLRFPAFEEWRLVTFGYHWTNADFLAAFQWLSGALIRISLPMFLIADMFQIRKGKPRMWFLIAVSGAATVLSSLPLTDIQFFALLYRDLIPNQFFWWSAAVILLAATIWIASKRRIQS